MKCSGFGRSLESCYQEAGKLCPNGYDIIDQSSSMVAIPQSGGGTLIAPRDRMAIECR